MKDDESLRKEEIERDAKEVVEELEMEHTENLKQRAEKLEAIKRILTLKKEIAEIAIEGEFQTRQRYLQRKTKGELK